MKQIHTKRKLYTFKNSSEAITGLIEIINSLEDRIEEVEKIGKEIENENFNLKYPSYH